jgi:hypothetical protein
MLTSVYENLRILLGLEIIIIIIIIILFIYFLFLPSYSLLSPIFEIFDLMFSDWISFLAYPNLFGIKGFVVVVVTRFGLIFSFIYLYIYTFIHIFYLSIGGSKLSQISNLPTSPF